MTINFFDPGDVPQPKDKIRIEHLGAEVLPDRWRIKIDLHVTPFQVRPNLAVVLLRDQSPDQPPHMIADMLILETMHNKMEFVLHIRERDLPDPAGDYRLKARLYFEGGVNNPQDEQQLALTVPPADPDPAQ